MRKRVLDAVRSKASASTCQHKGSDRSHHLAASLDGGAESQSVSARATRVVHLDALHRLRGRIRAACVAA
jgi:hypothetical protein